VPPLLLPPVTEAPPVAPPEPQPPLVEAPPVPS